MSINHTVSPAPVGSSLACAPQEFPWRSGLPMPPNLGEELASNLSGFHFRGLVPCIAVSHRKGDLLLRVDCLVHQKGSPKVAPTFFSYPLVQPVHHRPALPCCRLDQYIAYFLLCRRCDSHKQCPGPDGRYDIGGGVGQQDQPKIGRVLLHCPSQGSLRISCEVVGFIDHNHLKPLSCRLIHLLSLCNFFEQVLDNYSIVIADI